MTAPTYPKYTNQRDRRLAKEHALVHDFCTQSSVVSYTAAKRRGGMPPDRYEIEYSVRSIVGVNELNQPIYGNHHVVEITIPPSFPLGGQPSCYTKTPVWHPNIQFDGPFAGKICVNADALGHWHTLDMMIERIGEILQYKNYHALNTNPHPEDAKVATWVREFAEPMDIVNKYKNIVVDNTPLLDPSDEWKESREEKIQIIIGARRSNGPSVETEDIPAPTTPARRSITIEINK